MKKTAKKINWIKLIAFILVTMLIGSIFAIFLTGDMKEFENLNKPPLSPPGIVFGIAWTILYTLMGISLYIVNESDADLKKKASAYFIYGLQLFLNSIWTLFFFGLKFRLFAFIILLVLIICVGVMIYKFLKINRAAGLFQIPYLIWLLFAGYLNVMVYILN